MLSRLLALSLLTALPAAGTPLQEAQAIQKPPVLSVEELVLQYYQPKHAQASYLANKLEDLVGREFHVKERGGYASRSVDDIFQMGGAVGIYDTRDYVQRVLTLAAELDQRWESDAVPELETLQYRPRFLTIDVVEEALRPFNRRILVGDDYKSNISKVEERSILIVRDSPERLVEIRALLDALDVPEEQVRLTCWMIDGVPNSGHDSSLPKDLSTNLEKLLPGFGFQVRGFAMLQTTLSIGTSREVELNDERAIFKFRPTAYDAESGSLTVTYCELEQPETLSQHERSYFRTNAIFRGGEYTVLGAVGTQPVFLVVRVTGG